MNSKRPDINHFQQPFVTSDVKAEDNISNVSNNSEEKEEDPVSPNF